jgi:hypothetical protein
VSLPVESCVKVNILVLPTTHWSVGNSRLISCLTTADRARVVENCWCHAAVRPASYFGLGRLQISMLGRLLGMPFVPGGRHLLRQPTSRSGVGRAESVTSAGG